jgi:hypothetical protein
MSGKINLLRTHRGGRDLAERFLEDEQLVLPVTVVGEKG